jgi:hypothetical protein
VGEAKYGSIWGWLVHSYPHRIIGGESIEEYSSRVGDYL